MVYFYYKGQFGMFNNEEKESDIQAFLDLKANVQSTEELFALRF